MVCHRRDLRPARTREGIRPGVRLRRPAARTAGERGAARDAAQAPRPLPGGRPVLGAQMMRQLVLELAPPAAPTLENFFSGPNEAAVAALRDALANGEGERVVYLFGEPGSGKTHLLRAAVREAETLGQTARYVGAPHAALTMLPDCDVLAVDDIERLDIVSQLALFDAFNVLRARSR